MFGFVRKRVRRRRASRVKSKKALVHYDAHKEKARVRIHERLRHWSEVYALSYGRVAIRDQRTRWGSCSTKRNLNFNYKLVFLPEALIDYVIVHELCHLIEFNHSAAFWDHVARALPDYRERKKMLAMIPVHALYDAAIE